MKFSIVIPLHNEELNIKQLIDEIFSILEITDYSYEIILVNDFSTDNTQELILKIKDQNPKIIKIINNNKNLGQSLSLIRGIKSSIYQTIVTLDGDGQNNPANIPELINKYMSDDTIYLVGGIRVKRKDSLIKKYSSLIANNFRKFILNDDCLDTGCSLKVFDKKIFLSLPAFDGIHRFLPALFKGYKKKTFFIEVDHRPRLYGISKYGIFGRLIKGIIDIIRVVKIIKNYKQNNA